MDKRSKRVDAKAIRQKRLKELQIRYPHYTAKSNLVGGLFLLGLILIIWEIKIYEVTIIPLAIPLSIWLVTGLAMTPIFRRTFNIYCFNPYSPENIPWFFHIIYNTVSFGGILLFLFMWGNQHFKDQSKNVSIVPIVSSGQLGKSAHACGQPFVDVVLKGKEKELVFPCGTEIEKYKSVYIETSNGLFGFDVITRKTLKEGEW